MVPIPTLLITTFTILSLIAGTGRAQAGSPPAHSGSLERERDVRERMATLRVPFVENQGQVDPRVSFYAKTLGGTVFITTQGEIVYALPERNSRENGEGTRIGGTFVLTETLVDGKQGKVTGTDRSRTGVSYFTGNDRTKWKSHVPTYNTVSLGEVYEGIELTLKARGKTVEKLFTVQPGANPREIRLALQGPRSIRITEQGELEAETDSGAVTFTRPVAYQEIDGKRVEVTVEYEVTSSKGFESEHPTATLRAQQWLYTFRLSPYDRTRTLVIDPTFQSTYLGSYESEQISSVAIASDGTVYAAGWTYSPNFPGTAGGAQTSRQTTYESAFVSRLNADLTTLLQSTYLGSGYAVMAYAIAVGSNGNVYVAGKAWGGADVPGATGGAQPSNGGGVGDGFVTRLNAGLTTVLQSTYIGGSQGEWVNSMAIGPDGTVYVAGQTWSTDLPGRAGGAQPTYGGGGAYDGFVTRFNAGLTALLQSTYLGDGSSDYLYALAIGPDGTVYAAGQTLSSGFPGTAGGAQPYRSGQAEIFVTRFNVGLTTLLQSTYLGGSDYEYFGALAIALDGTVYVTGTTYSSNFPGTAGGFQSTPSNYYGFISRFNASLTTLLQSTYFGEGAALAIALDGTVYVAGTTYSSNFPGTAGGVQSCLGTGGDVFVSRLNAGLTTLYQSTFLGGSGTDNPYAMAIGPDGTVYVAGKTRSSNFPGTAGGAQPDFGWGTNDAFISKLPPILQGENPPPAVTATTPANNATDVAVSTTVSATFSGAMDPATITTSTFTLTGPSGSVLGVVSYDPSTNTATFTPSSALAASTWYTATITTGATSLTGTALECNYNWQFRTTLIAPPGAPTGISATPGDQQATITWVAPASDGGSAITGYTVTASPGGQTVTVGGSTTTATVTGLVNGVTYAFTVTAANAAGSGEASAPSNAVVPVSPLAPPGTPTGVSATPGVGTVTVSWTPPASDGGSPILGYLVTTSPDGQSLWVPADQTSVTFSMLTGGTAYIFTVQAHNEVGGSPSSAPSNGGTPVTVTKISTGPTGISATGGNQQATITWAVPASDGGSPITGYAVTASPGGQTVTVGSGTTTATVTGLINGTMYTFTVTATNAMGISPSSVSSNPVLVGLGPGAPLLVVARAGSGQATVTWYPYPAGISRVISYTVAASPGGQTVTVGGGTTTAVVTGLTNGVPYAFIVQALTDLGFAPASAPSDPVIPQ